ncbi:MAG TPA: hypothetical protein PKI20_03835 [Verrucomicrobiota bacterium]|jgi:hypothetical protein|nr:hypothetical protein [Verrucomicrobiota bacterium]
MRRQQLSCAQAARLVRLNLGEAFPRSELPKNVLQALQAGGVVQLEKSGSSYLVRGLPGRLAEFAAYHWGIRDLERYARATPDTRSRSMMAALAGDSKALPNGPLDGLFFRSFNNCFLGDRPLGLTPQGSAVLVSLGNLPGLRVTAGTLIATENAECLWNFENLLKFFPEVAQMQFAVVLRWHWGGVWRQWLKGWSGQVLYLPDYDPAGLRIFAAEVLPERPQAELLVPQDFEQLLEARGDRGLFLKQGDCLDFVEKFMHPPLIRVCRALRRTRKALEQESLLS